VHASVLFYYWFLYQKILQQVQADLLHLCDCSEPEPISGLTDRLTEDVPFDHSLDTYLWLMVIDQDPDHPGA
jgi:hypothetical protein